LNCSFELRLNEAKHDVNSKRSRELINKKGESFLEKFVMKLLRITLLIAVLANLIPEAVHIDGLKNPKKIKSSKQAKSFDGEEETKAKYRTEFTFTKGETPICLPVIFKGKEFCFILDTGSSNTVFDVLFKHELGKPKSLAEAKTTSDSILVQTYDALPAFIGPYSMQNCDKVACLNLKMLTLITGKEISGLIGMNFLRKHVLQIDFDNGRLLFLKIPKEKNFDWGEEFTISFNSLGLPQIKGNVLGRIKVDFTIDTGSNATGNLDRRIFEEILSKENLITSETLASTPSGLVKSKAARIDSLSIGSFRYHNLIFSEGDVNNLGLNFLSRHLVTFDFPNNRIYLKKGKEFLKMDESDMSGLHLLRISNETVVHSVDKDSPAAKAGIRSKDIILKVEGKNADEYEMWALRQLLRCEDKYNTTMTIQHDNDEREIAFLLRKKI
jgi:hypothetical protein